MAIGVQVTFDCANPDKLASFWAELLRYEKQRPPDGFATWDAFLHSQGVPESEWDAFSAIIDPKGKGPRLFFQRVPEPKTVKNRVHLDVNVGGPPGTPEEERRRTVGSEVERAKSLGATEVRKFDDPGEYWIVMQDPEGNEFCLQ